MKLCKRCGEEKPLGSFSFDTRRNKPRSECRACSAARMAEWQNKNRERVNVKAREYRLRYPDKVSSLSRKIKLREKYGITPEVYEAMNIAQGGVCGICERAPEKKRLAVDHDHTTGKVRALLCDACNQTLGKMNDDPALLRRAADYLELHGADGTEKNKFRVQTSRAPITCLAGSAERL